MHKSTSNRFILRVLGLVLIVACINPSMAEERDNGIYAGPALVFSERALERMLEASRQALEKADPEFSKASEKIGTVQGVRSSSRSSALDLTYKPTFRFVETIREVDNVDENGTRLTSSSRERASERTDPSQDVVIPTININNSNGPTAASDGGLGLSSLDNLAERTALFYRFINLRYLFTQSASQLTDKEPVLLGFDIAIEPTVKNRYQAAEVTITIAHKKDKPQNGVLEHPTKQPNSNPEAAAPAEPRGRTQSEEVELIQLFPLKETYNVLGAVETTSNIGFGIVLGPISLGSRNVSNDKQMYLVQDIDTVSFQRADSATLTFGWTFRPVLGRAWLSPGTRRVYALVAVPESMKGKTININVDTAWKDIDPASGLSKGQGPRQPYHYSSNVQLWHTDTAKPRLARLGSGQGSEKSLKTEINKVGEDVLELQVFGSKFTPDMSVSLAGEAINSFTVDSNRNCPLGDQRDDAHKQHAQKLTIFAPKSLVEKSSRLFVVNDWGSDEIRLEEAVGFPKLEDPAVASGVKILILSNGSLQQQVDTTTDDKSAAKKKILETPKTAVTVRGNNLKGGYLIVAGQVFPYASAKLKSDKYLLFEVDAKGLKENVSFVDASGHTHSEVENLVSPPSGEKSRKATPARP